MTTEVDDIEKTLIAETLDTAARHGLTLTKELSFNEMGLDFRVAFGKEQSGKKWVLRIPRRADIFSQIEQESKILEFVKTRVGVQVPEWKICTPELVAYPMLTDPTAISFDPQTYSVSWNINKDSEVYIESLALALANLHSSNVGEAVAVGIAANTSESSRKSLWADIERVKNQIGMGRELEAQWKSWISSDAIWPDFSVLTHGDLYAGHITADASSRVTGIIDWSEAEVADPAIDFAGHLAVFGVESLQALISAYARAGGKTWPSMIEQVSARHGASPLRYAVFALDSNNPDHIAAAKMQLGVAV